MNQKAGMTVIQKGFTLVELMIVIVVIAILAAITLVAYNGVTQQAQASKMLVSFDAWEKALRMYYDTHGTYPIPSTSLAEGNYGGCLGSNFSANGDFKMGECILVNGTNVHNYHENSEVNTMLSEYMNISKAEFPYRKFTVSGMELQQRGILYYASNTPTVNNGSVMLMYYITSNDKCGRGAKAYDPSTGFGICQVVLRESL